MCVKANDVGMSVGYVEAQICEHFLRTCATISAVVPASIWSVHVGAVIGATLYTLMHIAVREVDRYSALSFLSTNDPKLECVMANDVGMSVGCLEAQICRHFLRT